MAVLVNEHEAERMRIHLAELLRCDNITRYEYEFLIGLDKQETFTLNDAIIVCNMHNRYC